MFWLWQLSYIARPWSVDDLLLAVSLSGAVLFEMSLMMAAGDFITKHKPSMITRLLYSTSHSTNMFLYYVHEKCLNKSALALAVVS